MLKQEVKGRAVLLICEDVKQARLFINHFTDEDSEAGIKVIEYTRSHELNLEKLGKLKPNTLLIATNLAGRGADIKLTETVIKNDGLHVCLSYLPPNLRVQEQAYGRAARHGQPGSCRMIFLSQSTDDLNFAITRRDLLEAHRVADIKTDYEYNTKVQEELFEMFTSRYYKYDQKADISFVKLPENLLIYFCPCLIELNKRTMFDFNIS